MTSLIRFTPNRELRQMQREIDRLFENFFPARPEGNGDAETAVWSPRVDLAETADAYLIDLDVPGMAKDDFAINYHEGTLTVSGERKAEETKEERNYVRVERTYGHFYRSFTLPKAVNEEKIGAAYKDGVLSIRVPKAEESKPRRIKIA